MKRQSFFLAMVVLLAASSWAAGYSGGDGSAVNPYQIATAEDMNSIGANPVDWDAHFLLVADIDLAAYTGTQFNIIGNFGTPFTGVFDGAGHTISNFTYTTTDTWYIGIFGYVNDPNAEIKDLTLIDPNVNAAGDSDCVGSLVGLMYNGTISGCGVEGGSVSGYGFIGGLVGLNYDYGSISHCYATGEVSGDDWTGGLVGDNDGAISNCYATGSVSGEGEAGGLVGVNWHPGTISDCYATGSVSGDSFTGGLVGWNLCGTVSDCYATGSVSGGSDTGGLVGYNDAAKYEGTISNCYATGSVSGNGRTGGLVGWNAGTVSAVSASFWDIETGGPDNGIGTPLPTEQMQTESTFTDAGWDFVNIWDLTCEGMNYPRFIIPVDYLCPHGVDFKDYSFFADYWMDHNCGDSNDCDGCDLDLSDTVDANDLNIFCDHWLEGTTP